MGRIVRVTSLASGSSGNALVVEHAGEALLVDCGLAPRRLAGLIREAGIAPGELTAVLITHEHSDHVVGIGAVPKKSDIPFFMSPGTYRANPTVNGLLAFGGRRVVEQPVGSTRSVGTFEVTSFPVSHDGAEVCGYLIEAGGRSVAVFTDLGVAEPHLHEPLMHAELIVIEANHNEEMLWKGPYPWHLKRRVAGNQGHLSNAACSDLLCRVLPERGREIWLAHLSRTNNRPQIAASEVKQTLHRHGHGDLAHTVRVLPQWGPLVRWEPQARQLALAGLDSSTER
jgi:phosphoribosyl 1,2-cyclic phosphodiesterase